MKLEKEFLRGAYTPLVTPFCDGEVDLARYAELLEWQVREGCDGVVVCGTTGEPSSLTLDERCDLVKVAVETAAKRIPVVAATGSQSYQETVELTVRAQRLGADALLIVTPYYIKPPQEGLLEYFVSMGKLTALPLMIYHIPGRAAVSLEISTVERIAERTPTLVGVKHAVNDLDFVTELLAALGEDFRVFCGLESLSLPMLVVGASGLMNAVGNLTPGRLAGLCNAVKREDLEEARKLHFELFELNRAIFLSTNPIPLKYMMARLGLLETPEMRLPLFPLPENKEKLLDGVLRKSGLLETVSSGEGA